MQKYIERPLLLQGRKFDIRVWVVITDDQRIYFFKEFYVRTTSSEFSLSDLQTKVHLTNNSLQSTEKAYGQYEPGNTITFTNLK